MDWKKWKRQYRAIQAGEAVSNGEELWIKPESGDDEYEETHRLFDHLIGLQTGRVRHYSQVAPWRKWERSLICVQS